MQLISKNQYLVPKNMKPPKNIFNKEYFKQGNKQHFLLALLRQSGSKYIYI